MLQSMDIHDAVAAYFQHHGCGWGTEVTAFDLVYSYFYQVSSGLLFFLPVRISNRL